MPAVVKCIDSSVIRICSLGFPPSQGAPRSGSVARLGFNPCPLFQLLSEAVAKTIFPSHQIIFSLLMAHIDFSNGSSIKTESDMRDYKDKGRTAPGSSLELGKREKEMELLPTSI